MFWHSFKYELKTLLRVRELVFWNLIFPVALASFMFLAFGKISDATEKIEMIPVAVVEEQDSKVMDFVMEQLSTGEDALLDIQNVTEEKAEQLLKEEKIKGIIFEGEDTRLRVKESGMDQTVLQMILQQYKQQETAIKDVATEHPEKVASLVQGFSESVEVVKKEKMGDGNQDNLVNYFYAIFAMVCLFASFSGCNMVGNMQPNVSVMGQRRTVSPVHKMTTVLAEFAACELFQMVVVSLLLVYMRGILGIHLGNHYGAILLLLFVATSCGNMLGICIGCIPRFSMGAKTGILTGVSLLLSMMSDLMVAGVRDGIEHTVPIINDINPAALIVDSFYALNVYDTYERFAGNLFMLLIVTTILAVVSILLVRRNRYASL